MTEKIISIAMALLACLLIYWLNRRNSEEQEIEDEDISPSNEAPGATTKEASILEDTKQRVVKVLQQMNCEWKEVENDPTAIRFAYQSENFILRFNEANCFVRITDPSWYGFSDDDIDTLSKVKEVVNELNWNCGMTMCYTHDEEEKLFLVHTQHSLVATDGISLHEYFVNTLKAFFMTQHHFHRLLAEKGK